MTGIVKTGFFTELDRFVQLLLCKVTFFIIVISGPLDPPVHISSVHAVQESLGFTRSDGGQLFLGIVSSRGRGSTAIVTFLAFCDFVPGGCTPSI